MGAFESRAVIDQDKFTQTADELLGQVNDPSKTVVECMAAAQSVVQGLDDIEAGRLEVQPPLTSEQVEAYRESSGLIIALGQKAAKDLGESSKRGFLGRKQPASAPSPSYSGQGAEAKQ